MGYKLIIPGSNYGEAAPVDTYISESGITDQAIITNYAIFKQTLIDNAIWDKISHAYAILGTTADQVKLNIKNAADPLTNAGGGAIVNTINKGIVLAGVGNSQGATIDVPLNETFVENIRVGSGHTLYFINENLVATNTVTPGLGIPLSSNLFNQVQQLFYLTGAAAVAPQKKGFVMRNSTAVLSPNFLNKGVFGVIKNGNTVEFIGNGVSLGTTTPTGTATGYTGNIRIGDSKYPVANTVSFVSFGSVAMSTAEMIIYQNAIKTLIQAVHGIAV